MEFTPKSYTSPSICAACKNSFGLRKQYKVFDLTVCQICANEIRLKILEDNQLDSDQSSAKQKRHTVTLYCKQFTI